MATLRGPNGCPWDREQDRRTLKPMLVEETYEVLEAIDNNDIPGLREELGDLLLHVVFHAQLGKEAGEFDIGQVIDTLCDKLVRRHPHVFGSDTASSAEEVIRNWEAIKAEEKAEKLKGRPPEPGSLLEGIPARLPALHEAHQISSRAARAGFEWPDIEGVFDKLEEETMALARNFAQAPTKAIGLIKRTLNKSLYSDLETMLTYEAYIQQIASETDDHQEGIKAFLEKRKANYLGK